MDVFKHRKSNKMNIITKAVVLFSCLVFSTSSHFDEVDMENLMNQIEASQQAEETQEATALLHLVSLLFSVPGTFLSSDVHSADLSFYCLQDQLNREVDLQGQDVFRMVELERKALEDILEHERMITSVEVQYHTETLSNVDTASEKNANEQSIETLLQFSDQNPNDEIYGVKPKNNEKVHFLRSSGMR